MALEVVKEANVDLAKETVEVKTEEFKDFEFGDLYIQCSCGHEQMFLKGIEGIRVELPATNKHELKIVCNACKHELALRYKESENKDELRAAKEERRELIRQAQAAAMEEARAKAESIEPEELVAEEVVVENNNDNESGTVEQS